MKKWNWKHKVALVMLGWIAAVSAELLIEWGFGIGGPWGSLVGSVIAGWMAYAFWKEWWKHEVWGAYCMMTGLQYEFIGHRTTEALVYHVLLVLGGGYFLFRDELRQAWESYRSTRSDKARRQHLRNALKNIDAEMAKQREMRTRVSEELERIEPKPTYRESANEDAEASGPRKLKQTGSG